MTAEENKMWDDAFKDMDDMYKEIKNKNIVVLNLIKESNPIDLYDSILQVIKTITDLTVHESMSIVEESTGNQQIDKYGIIESVWIDQWGVGIEGDSYSGYLYVKLMDDSFLKIPYSC